MISFKDEILAALKRFGDQFDRIDQKLDSIDSGLDQINSQLYLVDKTLDEVNGYLNYQFTAQYPLK